MTCELHVNKAAIFKVNLVRTLGSVGKESCNAGDTGDKGLIPGWGRYPGRVTHSSMVTHSSILAW